MRISQSTITVSPQKIDEQSGCEKLSQANFGENLLSSSIQFNSGSSDAIKTTTQPQLFCKKQISSLGTVQKERMLLAAKLTDYPYHRDNEKLPNGWSCRKDIAQKVAQNIAHDTHIKYDESTGMLHSKSGLVAYVLSDSKEICLVFGGTSSGKTTGDLFVRNIRNPGMTFRQWGANGLNFLFGRTPKCYHEAESLTKLLLTIIPHGQQLTTMGHSLGGGESSYAAAMTGTKSINFCSAELSAKMRNRIIKTISEEGIEKLKENIHHFRVHGDIVPLTHNTGLDLSAVGTSYTIPTYSPGTALSFHDKYLRFVTEFYEQENLKPVTELVRETGYNTIWYQ